MEGEMERKGEKLASNAAAVPVLIGGGLAIMFWSVALILHHRHLH